MESPRFRSLWISDVHLGFKECKAEYLLDFLRQSDCERLYLVGDLIDFWNLRKGGRWPAAHGEVLKTIMAKARAGTRVLYVPGNHDEVARDYLGLRVNSVLYCNDGDWVESCTALVERPDGALEILRWSHQRAVVVAMREPRRLPETPPVPGWATGL